MVYPEARAFPQRWSFDAISLAKEQRRACYTLFHLCRVVFASSEARDVKIHRRFSRGAVMYRGGQNRVVIRRHAINIS